MPLLSAFTPCGFLEFSSAPSHAENIYNSLINTIGKPGETLSTEEHSRMRAWCYATAMSQARSRYLLEQGGNQIAPLRTAENFLATREDEYGIIPSPNAGPDERRAAIAAARKLPGGGSYNNVNNALITLLGSALKKYLPTPIAAAVVTPTSPGDQPMNLIPLQRLPKLIRILPAISINLGTPVWVQYEVIETPFIPEQSSPTLPAQNLLVGETVVVNPGHNTLHERCEVLDLRETVPGFKEIRLTFNNPHDPNTVAYNYVYPYWLSTRRFSLIILDAVRAADAETRRRTNEFLDKVLRAVTTWAIAREDPLNPGHTGTFNVGVSGLGTQTIGDVTW